MDKFDIKKVIALAIIANLLVLISGLFTPMIANAAKYAQVSREIFDSGDWINLSIAGDAYDQKPPLLFWIGAFAYKLFGVSQFSYKIAVIVASFAGIFGTYKLGELLYSKKTGLLAALFLSTSLGYLHFHNDIHTDTLLADLVILAIWQLALFFERKRNINFILGLIFTGLAMLTKGPVGLAIPAFAIGSHLLFRKKFNEIFHLRWLIAIPIVGIIILPALWGLFDQFGLEGIKFYFWTNNAGRITGSYQGSSNDFLFPIHTSAYLLAPWTIFAFTGFVMQIREKISRKIVDQTNNEYYTLGGILIFFLILTVSKSKMPHYLLSLLPLYMILASRWTLHLYEDAKNKRIINFMRGGNLMLSFLLLSIIPLFGFWFYPEKRILVWLTIGLALLTFGYALVKLKGLQKDIVFLLAAIAAIGFFINVSMLPNMSQYQSSLKTAAYFNQEAKENQKLSAFSTSSRYWSLFYYSKAPGYYMPATSDFQKREIPAGDWIYTDDIGLKQLDELKVQYDLKTTFEHRSMTSQSFKFLNPKTRAEHLQKRYLIQLK